jgi:GntP family gluconate:H+ symporter
MIHWLHDTTGGLLTLCGASIALLLLLIIKAKIEPFVALVASAFALALAAGMPVAKIVGGGDSETSILESGFGGILGHIAPIIGLGTVLGAVLEISGGADVLTRRLLNLFGPRGVPLAMGLAGLVFGIPVFFDVGVFVLAPLVLIAARRGGRSLVLYALPLLAGLSMTHAFIPPHPGPVTAASLLHVSLGWLIVMGLACGVPAFLVAGVAWGSWISKRVWVPVPDEVGAGAGDDGDRVPAQGSPSPASDAAVEAEQAATSAAESPTGTATATKTPGPVTTTGPSDGRPGEPSLAAVGLVIAVPMLLILLATFGSVWWKESPALPVLNFLGNPTVALTLARLLAMYLLGVRRGITLPELSRFSANSLRPVGMILLVVGAGAFYGAVISATGVGTALAHTLDQAGLPLMLMAYLISAGLRIAQGSATVAIVTTGGILGSFVEAQHLSQPQLALVAVAISAGSIIASHVNDGGFWMVSRFFNMTVRQTLMTWTVLETILSVAGFAVAGALSLVI